MSEFQKALGQYRIYKQVLSQLKPEVKVFLAIAESIYNKFFVGEGIQFIIEREEVVFFVVNLESEVIVKWIN